MSNRIWYFKSG